MGVGGIFKFGKSKASLWTSDQPRVTFKDVAGCEEAKEELKEVIDFLKNPNRFQKLELPCQKEHCWSVLQEQVKLYLQGQLQEKRLCPFTALVVQIL